jgi:sulfate permease, SulP family
VPCHCCGAALVRDGLASKWSALGTSRMSGVAASLVLGAVAIANLDLSGLIPIPIAAGLVFRLRYTFIVDALWRPYVQRAWLDMLLATGFAIVRIHYGYLVGVLGDIVGACSHFAVSYARIGAVRRHVPRAQFASNIDRSAESAKASARERRRHSALLAAGYIFFGSSEGVYERVRGHAARSGLLCHSRLCLVSRADLSAIFSLAKLRNFCNQQGITLVYSSLSAVNRRALELGGVLGGKRPCHVFTDLNQALAWCENQLLAKAGLGLRTGLTGFKPWLQRRLGQVVEAKDFIAYLEHKDVDASQILYHQGEPADCIDFVAAGRHCRRRGH